MQGLTRRKTLWPLFRNKRNMRQASPRFRLPRNAGTNGVSERQDKEQSGDNFKNGTVRRDVGQKTEKRRAKQKPRVPDYGNNRRGTRRRNR